MAPHSRGRSSTQPSAGAAWASAAAGTNEIYALDVLAVERAISASAHLIQGSRAILLVENDARAAAISRGCAPAGAPGVNLLVRSTWELAWRHSFALWVERVGPASNPADAPSRATTPYPESWIPLEP